MLILNIIAGAFLPAAATPIKSKKSQNQEIENYIKVHLRSNDSSIITQVKTYPVAPPQLFDFTNMIKVPVMFEINEEDFEDLQEPNQTLQLVIEARELSGTRYLHIQL